MIDSTIFELIGMFVFSMIYRISRILRYDLDYGSLADWMFFELRVEVFNVVLNHIEIRREHNFVGCDNEAMIVNPGKIDKIVRFDALKSIVETSNMFA